jgi:hypothetical protein
LQGGHNSLWSGRDTQSTTLPTHAQTHAMGVVKVTLKTLKNEKFDIELDEGMLVSAHSTPATSARAGLLTLIPSKR